MKTTTNFAAPFRSRRALLLLGSLAVAVITLGCSKNNSKTVTAAVQPAAGHVQPVALKTVVPVAAAAMAMDSESTGVTAAKRPSQPLTFRSRDYGVSFIYPWQYAFVSARTMANDDSSLQPKSDGSDGQFPLARVEIPAGFYPDTDFESGYLTVSLNQELSEDKCVAAFVSADAKVQTETINGVDFRWVESDTGGGGAAAKVRNYAAFVNGTCYEIEMGVTTQNDRGMSREVNTEQVFRRLDAILQTVNIAPAMRNSVAAKDAPPAPQQ